MPTTQRQPRVGDRAWHVDWCAGIPLDPETGDGDLDNADYRTETFWLEPDANERARKVLPLDAFGSVSVTAVEFLAYDDDDAACYPHVGFWEPIGEPEDFN